MGCAGSPPSPIVTDTAGAPLRVTAASIGYRTVLSATGEIDIATVSVLERALQAVLLSAERDVWIDLSDVGFMDSTGVHALIDARRALERDHRRLAIIAPDGPARRTMDATGIDGVLHIFSSRSAAQRFG